MFLHCQGMLSYKNFLPAVPGKSEVDLASLSLTISGWQRRGRKRKRKMPDWQGRRTCGLVFKEQIPCLLCFADISLQNCVSVVFITYWYMENKFHRKISLNFQVSKPTFCTFNSIILESFYNNLIIWSLNLTAVLCKRESSALVEAFKETISFRCLGFCYYFFLSRILLFVGQALCWNASKIKKVN